MHKLNYKLKTEDIFFNLFTSKKEKVKAYCGHCSRGVFNLNTRWARQGLCIYCWDMQNITVGDKRD